MTFVESNGNTPLHVAVERLREQANSEEYDPIVALLLQHNAAVNTVSYKEESPLYVACMKGLTGVVKQLLHYKAEVNLTASNSGKYPLLIACERKLRDIAMMLLDRGADTNVSKDKQTPLKIAITNGDVLLVEQLLACGADANQMRNISDTALHAAVRRKGLGDKDFKNIVQWLLKSGADANALNDRGETPLYLACRQQITKLPLTLCKHCSNVDQMPTYIRHIAIASIIFLSMVRPMLARHHGGANKLCLLCCMLSPATITS